MGIEHENERIDELVEMERKHLERKRKIAESREKFESDWNEMGCKMKKFNWMTATEDDVKDIKSWFKEKYGLETGDSNSETGASEKDSAENKQSANESTSATNEASNVQCNSNGIENNDHLTQSNNQFETDASFLPSSIAIAHDPNAPPSQLESGHDSYATSGEIHEDVTGTDFNPELYGSSHSDTATGGLHIGGASGRLVGPVSTEQIFVSEEEALVSAAAEAELSAAASRDAIEPPQITTLSHSINSDAQLSSQPSQQPPVSAEDSKEHQRDPDYNPLSEDSNLGMDEDSTDVPPTSDDDEDEPMQPSDISSAGGDQTDA